MKFIVFVCGKDDFEKFKGDRLGDGTYLERTDVSSDGVDTHILVLANKGEIRDIKENVLRVGIDAKATELLLKKYFKTLQAFLQDRFPFENKFDDVSSVVNFIRAVINGYSCVSLAQQCAKDILSRSNTDTITLMDGDKTITTEDSSNRVFGYTTHLYDGNFYTGYQSWKQGIEFEQYSFEDLTRMPVSLNEKVCKAIDGNTFILTSGHERVWGFIAKRLGVPYYFGTEMSAETKLYVTKILQKAGKRVVAYGDGMNDYYMLKQANEGFLVTKQDSTISRSLKGKDLEGLKIV